MNDHEAQRIAAAISAARPDWPAASLLTLIRKNLAERPRRDVFVALAWVASEPNSATPARVLEAGPWWKAAAADDTSTHHHAAKTYGWNEGDPRTICGICDLAQAECQRRSAVNGHEFTPRTRCLPPIDHGIAIGGVRANRACGAAILGGSVCRLQSGHEGDHDMTTTPTDPPRDLEESNG